MIAAFLLLIQAGLPNLAGETLPGEVPIAPQVGSVAPDFSAPTVSGTLINLAAMRGQTVIINFWATWCGPCQVEMPILQRLHDNQPDLRILAVNMGESPTIIREWQQQTNLTYDLLIDEQQTIATLYQLRGQPSTYIVAPNGIITNIFFGPVSESTLVASLGRSSEA